MIIEVRAGEGGKDAESFVHELAQAYLHHLEALG